MSEKPFTGEPRIKLFAGIGFKIPAPPAQLTFSITDNQPEMRSLVIFSKHIAVSCFDGNSLFA
ncbi:hypothetical protein AC16_3959 [Escherichia coli 2-177-06_S3_C2]|nr:hypothetical protein ECSTECS1191_5118 [Escherichia coli STEC_S1191]KDA55428.1 hypothetical protein AA98_4784 [Escherichia coli 2-011-08_S1_C1]KDX42809.1 hypothetical protein AC16_3959 [Escherichia coli 2-177-06_S3_C2]KEO10429.1 hypothetical protein AC44_2473 [Escherichia coli 2-177-06_S3_C3]